VRQAETVKAARAALRGQTVGADRQLEAGAVVAKDSAGEAEELTDEDKRKIDAYAYVHDKSKTVKLPAPEAEFVGVAKPGDTKVVKLSSESDHNTDDPQHNSKAYKPRKTAAQVAQDNAGAGGGEPPATKS
jgi:hypothetical protein